MKEPVKLVSDHLPVTVLIRINGNLIFKPSPGPVFGCLHFTVCRKVASDQKLEVGKAWECKTNQEHMITYKSVILRTGSLSKSV